MSDAMMKMQVLTRAELALAQIRLQRSLRQAAWLAMAGLVGLVSLMMIDVAIYHALTPWRGPAIAALSIAVPTDPRRSKGFVGQLVELALGADPEAGDRPDLLVPEFCTSRRLSYARH